MGLGVLLATVSVLLGVLLTAGYTSTKLLVSNGLDRLMGEERAAAQHALLWAGIGCLDNPIERVLTPKIRVADVKLEPGYCPVNARRVRHYQAVIRSYTFFGIPAGTISVSCGAVNCR